MGMDMMMKKIRVHNSLSDISNKNGSIHKNGVSIHNYYGLVFFMVDSIIIMVLAIFFTNLYKTKGI